MYGEVFEGRFLEATERLYGQEGERLLQEVEVPAYLQHVERRLGEEQERLLYYLDHSTKCVGSRMCSHTPLSALSAC